MDNSPEQPLKKLSTEVAVFKDLAGLLKLSVEELHRHASDGLDRMPEVKAALQAQLEQSQASPIFRTLTRGIHNFNISMTSEVFDTIKLSTGVVLKAREIFGRKKE